MKSRVEVIIEIEDTVDVIVEKAVGLLGVAMYRALVDQSHKLLYDDLNHLIQFAMDVRGDIRRTHPEVLLETNAK